MHNWALKQLCAEKRTVNNCLQWEFYTVFKYNKLSNKIYLSTLIKKKKIHAVQNTKGSRNLLFILEIYI